MFSHTRKSSQEILSDREGSSSGHQPVEGKGQIFHRFSDPEEAARLVLEEQRDHLLAEGKSEILKQECKVDTLDTCIREFQRQAHSNRLEMDNVHYGYEESRREQTEVSQSSKKRAKLLFLTYRGLVSPSTIRNETGGKRIRCRLRSLNAHAEQERSELSRMETVRVSENPTTVVTANGEVQTNDEATRYVKEFDLFLTVKLLEDTPAVLSLGKLCEGHGCSFEWTSGQKPQLIENGRRTQCSTENYVQSLSLVYRPALPAQLHIHLQHCYRRTL